MASGSIQTTEVINDYWFEMRWSSLVNLNITFDFGSRILFFTWAINAIAHCACL